MKHVSAATRNNFHPSFLSYERDMEILLRKIFVDNREYSEDLKRLLVINEPDCLSRSNEQYSQIVKQYSLKKLKDEGYVRLVPRLDLKEHEPIKTYIIVTIDDYVPTSNDQYRDCVIFFRIIGEYDCMEMDNYQNRVVKVAGYIDGIVNHSKLTNIGTLRFMGAEQFSLNEYWGGLSLQYLATHDNKEDSNPKAG